MAGEGTFAAGGGGGGGGVEARATPAPLPWSGVVGDPEMPEIMVMPFVEIKMLPSIEGNGTNSPYFRRKIHLLSGREGFHQHSRDVSHYFDWAYTDARERRTRR